MNKQKKLLIASGLWLVLGLSLYLNDLRVLGDLSIIISSVFTAASLAISATKQNKEEK